MKNLTKLSMVALGLVSLLTSQLALADGARKYDWEVTPPQTILIGMANGAFASASFSNLMSARTLITAIKAANLLKIPTGGAVATLSAGRVAAFATAGAALAGVVYIADADYVLEKDKAHKLEVVLTALDGRDSRRYKVYDGDTKNVGYSFTDRASATAFMHELAARKDAAQRSTQ